MHLFFCPDINTDSYILSPEESRHCIKVLRLKKDDTVFLTNGKGTSYETLILDENPKKCTLKVVRKEYYEIPKPHIHIAVAPTKNINRLEWFLEKATEIGISEITPIICENSERRILNTERLKKILVAAMKQSLKMHLPKLNEPISFPKLLAKENSSQKYIAYCSEEYRDQLKDKIAPEEDSILLIGPEGDFSPSEIRGALELGYQAVSLGNSRLRTETAALVACHTFKLLNS